MHRTVAKFVLFLLVCLGGERTAARDYVMPFVFQPVTDADWAVRADSARDIHEAVFLFEKVHVDDGVLTKLTEKQLSKKSCHRAIYRRIRILNEAGRAWGDVEAPFFHMEQETILVRGRTTLPDGTTIDLRPDNVFEKEIVKTKDEKYKQTTFSLPGVTDDCIVEYIIVTKAPYNFREWELQKSIPLLEFSYDWVLWEMYLTQDVIDFLVDQPLLDFTIPNYLWLSSSAGQSITRLPSPDNTKEILFRSSNIPAFEEEPYSLPVNSLKDRLICYYGSKIAPMTYWGKLAQSESNLVTEFCRKNKEVKEVAEQFAGLASDREKIAAAYDWVVTNITNISYFDLHDPKDSTKIKDPEPRRSVGDVVKKGYGSIWDINCLFFNLLTELNIDAQYGRGRDRSDDLFTQQAKYDQFDRSLVEVSSSGLGAKYYCPGYGCTPCGCVPWWMEGTTALMVNADEYLMTVPFSSPTVNTATIRTQLDVNDDLSLSGTVEASMTGQYGRSLRYEIFDEKAGEHQELLTGAVEDNYPEAEMDSIVYTNLGNLKEPFGLSFGLSFPALSEIGGKILLKPCDYLSASENRFVAEERTSPILFDFASDETESVTFKLPEGWAVEAMPTDSTYRNKIGQCEISFAIDETGALTVERRLMVKMPYWQVEDYPHIRRLYQAYQKMNEQIVVLAQK
jgi:hypothetical protein